MYEGVQCQRISNIFSKNTVKCKQNRQNNANKNISSINNNNNTCAYQVKNFQKNSLNRKRQQQEIRRLKRGHRHLLLSTDAKRKNSLTSDQKSSSTNSLSLSSQSGATTVGERKKQKNKRRRKKKRQQEQELQKLLKLNILFANEKEEDRDVDLDFDGIFFDFAEEIKKYRGVEEWFNDGRSGEDTETDSVISCENENQLDCVILTIDNYKLIMSDNSGGGPLANNKKRGHQYHPRLAGTRRSNVPAEEVIAALRRGGTIDLSTVTAVSTPITTSTASITSTPVPVSFQERPNVLSLGVTTADGLNREVIGGGDDSIKQEGFVDNHHVTTTSGTTKSMNECDNLMDVNKNILNNITNLQQVATTTNNNQIDIITIASDSESNGNSEQDHHNNSALPYTISLNNKSLPLYSCSPTPTDDSSIAEDTKTKKTSSNKNNKKEKSSKDSKSDTVSPKKEKKKKKKKDKNTSHNSSNNNNNYDNDILGVGNDHTEFPNYERASGDGAPADDTADIENDPEAAEWARLRCTSERTEVVAEREHRRQKRCADYPGLAFGRSIFSSDTMMKFNIIRNELHNIMKTQLKRVKTYVHLKKKNNFAFKF